MTPSIDPTPEMQPSFNPFPTATGFEPALQCAAQPDSEPTVVDLAFANSGSESASQFGQAVFGGLLIGKKTE